MKIYNKNKKHWSQVQMMGCLHMYMLKNVSLHVIAVYSHSQTIFRYLEEKTSGDLPIPSWFWCAGMLAHCSILI